MIVVSILAYFHFVSNIDHKGNKRNVYYMGKKNLMKKQLTIKKLNKHGRYKVNILDHLLQMTNFNP